MNLKLLLILSLVGLGLTAKQLISKRVVYSIDSGSTSSRKSHSGYSFEKDKDYSSDTINVDYSTDSNYNGAIIKYTYDPEIYMTERHAYKSFSYNIPLPQKDGTYVLILKFAEMYFKEGDKRVFNIKIGDQRVVVGLDVAGKVGRFAAYDEYVEIEYQDGGIYFKDTVCQKAIKDGKFIVTFEKTQKDNPFVHGLLLYEGTLKDTDYHERDSFRQEWERNYKQEMRKKDLEKAQKQDLRTQQKEKIKPRNDYSNDEEDDFELENVETEQKVVQERFSIQKFLTSFVGIILISFGLATGLLIIKKIIIDPMDYNNLAKTAAVKQVQVESPQNIQKKEDTPTADAPQKNTKDDKKKQN